MNWTYLTIDLASISVPLIYSFLSKYKFARVWKAFWPACLIAAFIFIVWDIIFTKMGVWGFNPKYLVGIDLVNLPIEEVLFFICIPYACVFTYFSADILLKKDYLGPYVRVISIALSTFLIVLGTMNYGKAYTSVTFVSLSIFLMLLTFYWKVKWLGIFYLSFALILIPFFIVNGLLTGSGLEEPVVWYNDDENLGIRMFTIPFEDTFYGMLLIVLNVSIYEYLKSRFNLSAGPE